MMQRARFFVAKQTAASKVEKCVLTATNFSRSEPRPESIAQLVQATHQRTEHENPARVLECLQDRVESEAGWQPVLKTLFVIHRLLQDGSDAFAVELERDTAVLSLSSFSDRTNGEAVHYSKHIRVYCEYLEETLLVRAEMRKLVPGVHLSLVARKADRGRPSEIDNVDSIATLLDVLAVIQPHLDRLLRCERCARPRNLPSEENCPIAHAVLALLLRDGLHVYRLVSEATMRALNVFTKLPAELAVGALALYTRFVESTRQFTSMCDFMRRLHAQGYLAGLDIPQLKPVDHERVVQALHRHVQSIDPTGEVARKVAANASRPPSERISEPVVGELEQLHQLQAWSKRQFGGRASNLQGEEREERNDDLLSLSPEGHAPPQQQPAVERARSAFDDMLLLEQPLAGVALQPQSAQPTAASGGQPADLLGGLFAPAPHAVASGQSGQQQPHFYSNGFGGGLDGTAPPPSMPPPPPPLIGDAAVLEQLSSPPMMTPPPPPVQQHSAPGGQQAGSSAPYGPSALQQHAPHHLTQQHAHATQNGMGFWHGPQAQQPHAQPKQEAHASITQHAAAWHAAPADPFGLAPQLTVAGQPGSFAAAPNPFDDHHVQQSRGSQAGSFKAADPFGAPMGSFSQQAAGGSGSEATSFKGQGAFQGGLS